MDHFDYRDGVLHAEDVPLPEIAAAVGTPVYVYSTATLTRHYRVFEEALAGLDHVICYAMKANSNLAVLRLMASLGAGMDVVSEGEYRRARAAGVPGRADRLLGRRQDPRGDARSRSITASASSTSSRSPSSSRFPRSRARMGAVAPIAIRVNPDVDAQDPRQDRDRQVGEQVRHPDRPGARGLRRGGGACRASRSSGSTCTSAAS